VCLLTDPILRRRFAHLFRRTQAPKIDAASVDAVLLSHVHHDHLDVPSLRRLRRKTTRVVIPRGAGKIVSRLGFSDVVEVVDGDEVEAGGLRVRVTHADHAPGRYRPTGPAAVGYLVYGSLSVYFAGDTDLFPEMETLEPDLDLALLPVGGWGPKIPEGHLNPERAAEALRRIRPRLAVPIHWGTFQPLYRSKPYPESAGAGPRFAELAQTAAPDVEVRVLAPGETCAVGGSPPRFIQPG
jgi:L-ascorbate metabolism protein UlaG (beta-lactamase superfamily)